MAVLQSICAVALFSLKLLPWVTLVEFVALLIEICSLGTVTIEMHQSQLLKTSQSERSIVLDKVRRNCPTTLPDENWKCGDSHHK